MPSLQGVRGHAALKINASFLSKCHGREPVGIYLAERASVRGTPTERMERMKRAWHPEELVEHWSVLPEDWPLIEPKQHVTRLGFTVLLKFFQYAGAFPRA